MNVSSRPPEPLYGAAEFVRGDAGVALRGVEVLVTEQLLDLAQVGAGAQELRGEHVPERVRRYALALGDASGAGVTEKSLGHDRL